MKARVKATGALLEVRLQDIDTEYPYICDMQGEGGTLWKESELEFLEDDPDYWTRLEHQYAGMAMQGMLNNSYLAGEFRRDPNNGIEDMSKIITKAAAVYAHALVEKLKEKEEK